MAKVSPMKMKNWKEAYEKAQQDLRQKQIEASKHQTSVGEKLRIILKHYLPHLLTIEGDINPNLDGNSIESGLQKMVDVDSSSGFKPQPLETGQLTPSADDSKPIRLIHHIRFGDQKFFNALKSHERESGLAQSGKIKFGDQKFFKAQVWS